MHCIKPHWLIVAMLLMSPSAMATVDGERAELKLIQRHIQKLYYLIDRAEQEADVRQSHQFYYDALRADLADIESGINIYLNPSRAGAKPIRPLSGDYLLGQGDE